MNNPISKKIATLVMVLFALMICAERAHALTLSPARFELSGNPGETVRGEIVLTNESESTTTYYSSFSNFEAQGETGSPSFVEPTEGLGTWMDTEDSIVLTEGVSKIVPYSIHIPANAAPGGYFAAIFFGTADPRADQGTVAVGAKTGVLILLRVNGEVDERGGILAFATVEETKFFTSLPVSFYYRFQNTGGDRIKPEGEIAIKHFLGFARAKVPANIAEGNVLPQQIRRFEASWQSKNGSETEYGTGFFESVKREWQNFAFGYYTGNLSLAYGEANARETSAKVGFWVIPWHLLVSLVVLFALVRFLWRKVSKHRRESLMQTMREEIKRELKEESTTDSTPKV